LSSSCVPYIASFSGLSLRCSLTCILWTGNINIQFMGLSYIIQ
jgi:hypothetical protein